MIQNAELLVGLTEGELEALAEGMLVPSSQSRLNELLAGHKAGTITDAERRELDRLLTQIDQLTVLKARARYTLGQRAGTTS